MKPLSPFLKLPGEIRNQIYDYVLEPPDLNLIFTMHLRKWRTMQNLWIHSYRPSTYFFKPRVESFATPAILLLNRQIHSEAVSFLRSKPLVISSPPPHNAELGRDLEITEFISVATLKKFHHIVLEMDFLLHSWQNTLNRLFEVWVEENNLKSFHVRIKRKKNVGLVTMRASQDDITSHILSQLGTFAYEPSCITLEYADSGLSTIEVKRL